MHDEQLAWFTSSFSGSSDGSCVEVAHLPGGGVAVRDTKDRARPAHRHTAAGWSAFLAGVRDGGFDRRV